MINNEIQIGLSRKQHEAITVLRDKETNQLLFGGAAGGAKSFLGCYWIVDNCLEYAGTRWLIGRSKLKNLKDTTLNTFWDVCKLLHLKKDIHYRYNDQTSKIKFTNGSEVFLKDLFQYPSDKNFDSLGSLEITGSFIDECNQITSTARDVVYSRIRYKLDENGLIPKLLMTCNPAKNWVYSEFYEPSIKNKLERNKRFIQALVTDNPFISKHYVESLRSMKSEALKQRLLNGNWNYDDDPNILIPYQNVTELFTNEVLPDFNDKWIVADIAGRGSDLFVIAVWSGWVLHHIEVVGKSGGMEIVDTLKKLMRKFKVSENRVIYDADGLGFFVGGEGGFLPKAHPFNNNKRPEFVKKANYKNLKAYCAYKLAQKAKSKEIRFYKCEKHKERIIKEINQLRGKYLEDDTRTMDLVSKDEIKQNLGFSPDYLDTLIMRMYSEKVKHKYTGIGHIE